MSETPSRANAWKQWGKFVLKLLVSGLALYLVFTRIDLAEIGAVLRQSQWPWLFPALAAFVLSQYLSAIRLNVFLHRLDIPLTHSYNFKLYLLGMFYNLFLPGGIGGDGYKVYLLNRLFGKGVRPLVSALLLDRLVGLVALGTLGVLFFYFSGVEAPYGKWYGGVLPLGGLCFFFLVWKWFPRWMPDLPRVIGWSFAVQLAQVLSACFLLLGLGQEGAFVGYLCLFLLSSIAAAVPFTIGGAGARELAFLFGAPFFGLDQALAITLSLLFYLLTVLVSLAGGYYTFRHPQAECWENERKVLKK